MKTDELESPNAQNIVRSDGQDSVGAENTRRHVLVIEDDQVITELLRDILSGSGFPVLLANNAQVGIELLEQNAKNTLCILLDYGIPGMHISRLLHRFQQIDHAVKIILSSGYPQSYIVKEFPLHSVSGFMQKPFQPQTLLLELQRILVE